MAHKSERIAQKIRLWPGFRVFRHADFRLLWLGTFLSFTGTQIQTVAQSAYVYQITGSKTALGMVAFCSMIPITVFGPVAGIVADLFDRRKILVTTSVLVALFTAWNAIAAQLGVLAYWQILLVATVGGLVAVVEQPSRQTIVREVVGDDDLASAIPAQAMTFNLARIIGPAIGGVLVAAVGVFVCFWVNAVSYFGIAGAALALKTSLKPRPRTSQPVRDLIFEGMLYTFRDPTLRTLFLVEGGLSVFGIGYIAQIPAIAKDMLRLNEAGLGMCYSSVGIGALAGLVLMATVSDRPYKTIATRIAVTVFSLALTGLSYAPTPWIALPLMGLLGTSAMMQFNTTNTLFQLLSPSRLRGRVLSMHMWAIGGLAPICSMWMGTLADQIGLRETLLIGGVLVALTATFGWINRRLVPEPKGPLETV